MAILIISSVSLAISIVAMCSATKNLKKKELKIERSEAKKAADKRYADKIRKEGKYKDFEVHFNVDEYERICDVIKASGMTKADFIRFGVRILEERG